MSSNTDTAISGALEKLRTERKLKLITEEQAGSAAEFAPAGVYGFTYSPASDGLPIFNKQTFQIFEVHKLLDESVHLVGFMTDEDAAAVDSGNATAEIRIYPQAYEKAQRIVSIPKERIMRAKPPSRENGNWMGIILFAK